MLINTLLGVKANLFFIFALFLINIYLTMSSSTPGKRYEVIRI